ncbi:MAG TPA: helix-turn-helix domain-containing protein, partial [Candidatus Acidoferrum sp.]|nr:helix-turn-helix domain-containing protein [Candidatus Acidoferrum sp.]
QNVMERAVIISTGPELGLDVADLKFPKANPSEERAAAPNSKTNGALRDVLGETERLQILQALKRSNWVVAGPDGAAVRLGMKRSTLQLRIQKLGITRHSA